VGHPVSHSLSPKIHTWFAKQVGISIDYQALELPLEGFALNVKKLFFEAGISGLSVTAPFKKEAYELAEVVTPAARVAESVNTLWVNNGKIHGDNTDGAGLIRDLTDSYHLDLRNKKILIIGAGGAAQGIVGPLLNAGAKITFTNRSPIPKDHWLRQFSSLTFLDFNDVKGEFDLVIHATSLGLKEAHLSFPFARQMKDVFAYDLSYSRSRQTPFTAWARASGAKTAVDGLGMLVEQAALQFEIFNGVKPSVSHFVI
jgi:shikimate dehydrogenase